jgi:hypothetical protein
MSNENKSKKEEKPQKPQKPEPPPSRLIKENEDKRKKKNR